MFLRAVAVIASLLPLSSFALEVSRTVHSADRSHVHITVTPSSTSSAGDLDLLFLIDDSGSMSNHQRLLSAQSSRLAAELARFPSLNVAITTSSTIGDCGGGRFCGSPAVLHSSSADFGSQLGKRLQVGTNGDPYEMFFDPIMAALTPPLSENENAGFLRPQAHLGVILVTDAEDQSAKATSESFVAFLEGLKGKGGFTLNAFLANSPDCAKDEREALRLKQAVSLAGGSVFNLCEGDFVKGISHFGGSIIRKMAGTIKLPLIPVVSTIQVRSGSTVLVGGDMHFGWIYDSVNNALVLGDQIDWNAAPMGNLEVEFDVL